MNNKLATLLKRADVWQSSATQQPHLTIPTGHTRLDAALHQGGWPTQALTEILCDQPGSGELQLLLPAVKKLCAKGRQLVFINPPHLPYAPALQQAGIAPKQVLVITPQTSADQLWTVEQTLRADVAAALLVWPQRVPDLSQLRKLQIAAQSTQGLSLLMRPVSSAAESSPAALKLQLKPTPAGCQLTIIKQRGGWAGQVLELNLAETLTESTLPPAELPVHQPPASPPDNPSPRRNDFGRDSLSWRKQEVAAKATPTNSDTVPSWLH